MKISKLKTKVNTINKIKKAIELAITYKRLEKEVGVTDETIRVYKEYTQMVEGLTENERKFILDRVISHQITQRLHRFGQTKKIRISKI